jgi:hypothetical protein
MSESPVFTGDFGFSRPYELRNSGCGERGFAAWGVAEHADAAQLLERVELEREILLVSRHARVADELTAAGDSAGATAAPGT